MNEIQNCKASRELLPAPTNMKEAMDLATTLAESGMVPAVYEHKPQAVLVAMMWAKALGIPLVQGLQYIAVVRGKPSMYGDGLLAVVKASGFLQDIKEEVVETSDRKLVATCTVWRKGAPTPVSNTFSQDDAIKAGLWNNTPTWKGYPKRMLKMRARAYSLRDAFPDVLAGMASAEEQDDIIDVVPTEKAAAPEPAKPKMPRRKAPEKKTAPAIENNPSPSAADVVPQPAAVPESVPEEVQAAEPAPVPEEAPAVDPATGEVQGEPDLNNAADLATPEEWMAAADMCANLRELMATFKMIPAPLLEAHPEIREKFTDCKNRLKEAAK